MLASPTFHVLAIDFFERAVSLRLPFRFGAVTLTEALQVFVRARIRLPDGRESVGASAELMVPKWFDKDPTLSNDDHVDQLRLALGLARAAYLADSIPRSAFSHFAVHYAACLAEGERNGLPALVAQFGPAEIDRAILDALCGALGVSFPTAVHANLIGFDAAAIAPDLAGFDCAGFLRGLAPRERVALRHTVGLLDAIGGHPRRANDGLPESLEEVIAVYGPIWFKLKLSGDIGPDLARLVEVSAVLDAQPTYHVTLDGNEQFADPAALGELLARVDAEPRLRRLAAAIVFIEQPLSRQVALECAVAPIATTRPLLIDESDAAIDAFPRALSRLRRGVQQELQGLVQVARQSGPLPKLERRRRCSPLLPVGRGSDHAARPGDAAGPGARRNARHRARRAQRAPLRQWHGRCTAGRASRVSRRTPGPLRAIARCGAPGRARRHALAALARGTGLRQWRHAGLVVARPATRGRARSASHRAGGRRRRLRFTRLIAYGAAAWQRNDWASS